MRVGPWQLQCAYKVGLMLMLSRPSQQKIQKYSRAIIREPGRSPELNKFAGIQNSFRIER
jgi:hypothetical protein